MNDEEIIGYEALYESMEKCRLGVLWKDSVAHFVLKRMGQDRDRAVLQKKTDAVLRRYFLSRDKEGAVVADQLSKRFVDR